MTSVPAAPADTEGSDTGAWLWPLLFLAAYAAVLAWKQQAFAGVVPLGDHAADDLLIVDAKRLALLHGVYSRLGFYHPGPLVLQISALGELILFDALRWFSSYYLAQVFVTALLHGIGLALVLRLWLVVTGNVVVALLAVAAVMAAISRGGSPDILLKYWIPHSTVAGATMLATAFAGLLLRGPSWLPLLAVGAVLLINAHVGFVLIVPALVIAVALTAIMAGRLPFAVFDGAATLRYAAMHRGPIALSAAIMALGLTPIAINLIANWPADLPTYLAIARNLPLTNPLDLLRIIVRFVPLYGVWMLVFLPWVRPASESRTEADPHRRHYLVLQRAHRRVRRVTARDRPARHSPRVLLDDGIFRHGGRGRHRLRVVGVAPPAGANRHRDRHHRVGGKSDCQGNAALASPQHAGGRRGRGHARRTRRPGRQVRHRARHEP